MRRDPQGTGQWLMALTPGLSVSTGAASPVESTAPALSTAAGPYALNPLLDGLDPAVRASAMASGVPAPTLFVSGDLPPLTASGVDPVDLLRLPWQARHEAAGERDRAQVLGIFESYTDSPDGAATQFGSDRRNREYESRLSQWAADHVGEDVAYAGLFGAEALDRAQAAETADGTP